MGTGELGGVPPDQGDAQPLDQVDDHHPPLLPRVGDQDPTQLGQLLGCLRVPTPSTETVKLINHCILNCFEIVRSCYLIEILF